MAKLPPSELLKALGLVTYRWAGLEVMIETMCARIYKSGLSPPKDGKPPKPFGSRLRYIRSSMKHPLFVHIRNDLESAIQAASHLATERNDRIHGAFTSSATQTVIKSHDLGYIAIMDISASPRDLNELAKRISILFSKLYNINDRLRALLHAYDGDSEISRKAYLDEF